MWVKVKEERKKLTPYSGPKDIFIRLTETMILNYIGSGKQLNKQPLLSGNQ